MQLNYFEIWKLKFYRTVPLVSNNISVSGRGTYEVRISYFVAGVSAREMRRSYFANDKSGAALAFHNNVRVTSVQGRRPYYAYFFYFSRFAVRDGVFENTYASAWKYLFAHSVQTSVFDVELVGTQLFELK